MPLRLPAILAIAIAIVAASRAPAATWRATLGTASRDRAQDVALAPDGGAFALAMSSDTTTGEGVVVARWDAAGAPLWQRNVSDGTRAQASAGGIAALASGGCVVAVNYGGRPLVIALDDAGAVRWESVLGDTTNVLQARAVTAMPSGGALVASSRRAGSADSLLLARFDGAGAMTWQRIESVAGCALTPVFASATPDDGALLAGSCNTAPSGGWLMRVDASGAVAWSRSVTDAGGVSAFFASPLADGGALAGGGQSGGPWCARLRADGSLAWNVGASAPEAGSFARGGELSDGRLVLAGDGFNAGNGQGEVALADSGGAVLGRAYASDVATLTAMIVDGAELLMSGATYAGGSGTGDALVQRADLRGEVGGACGASQDAALALAPWSGAIAALAVAPLATSEPVSAGSVTPSVPAWTAISPCGCTADAYEQDDACDPLAPFLVVGGTLSRGECDDASDWARFDACAGVTYRLEATAIGPGAQPRIEVVDPGCATLLASADPVAGASALDFTPLLDGTYGVRVVNAGGPAPDSDCTLTVTGSCTSARWWRRYGRLGTGDRFDDVTRSAAGGFVAVGESRRQVAIVDDAPWLVRLDDAGRIAWEARYATGDVTSESGVLELRNGDLLVYGRIQPPALTAGDMFAMRVDATGAITWQVAIGDAPTDESPSGAAERADGTIVLAGMTSPLLFDLRSWLVVELAADGTLLGQRTLGGSFDAALSDLAVMPAGELVLSGAVTTTTLTRGWVVELDARGNIAWQRIHERGLFLFHDAVAALPGGGVLLAGTTGDDPAQSDGLLLRLDASGLLAGDVAIAGSRSESVYGLAVAADGSAALTGAIAQGAGSDDLWLVTIDPSGTPVEQWAYGAEPEADRGEAIAARPGGWIVAGHGQQPGIGADEGWVMALGRDGSTQSPCGDATAVAIATQPGNVLENVTTIAFAASALGVRDPGFTLEASVSIVRELCAGFDASGVQPPTEVSPRGSASPLKLTSRSRLTWEDGAASGSSWFNVYRGDVRALRSRDYGACLLADVATSFADDAMLPGAGSAWFYLVTGENVAGEGPLGFDSFGALEVNLAPCP